MASTADFRKGMIIVFNGELYKIVEYQHSKMGRAGAVIRTKMKNILDGRVLDNTFRSGEKVEEARVEAQVMQYSYKDGDFYYMMNPETYDQIPVSSDIIGEDEKFLIENEDIKVLMYQDKPIAIELPTSVILKVTYTEPGEKGNTAKTNVLKPAKLENGVEVGVPLFINEGDLVKVDTRTAEYVERVKNK